MRRAGANLMALTVLDIEQGTDEWHAARCGMVTASVVGQLLTPTLRVADNATSRGLTHTLVSERITGRAEAGYIGSDMWRGYEDEPRAREVYSEHLAPVSEVGFMVRTDWGFSLGYSPDGLVGDVGLIEIKSKLPKLHLATILADTVPAEFMAQIQCGLLVSGRAWCDYLSYCGGMPLWIRRVYPDAAWHAAILTAVEAFETAADDMATRYRVAVAGLPLTERTPDYVEMVI